jgi:Protein of unknown function (DUF1552)
MAFMLSRRALLRGGSVVVGLPLLEAMLPRRAMAATAPTRLVTFFAPNSLPLEHFVPATVGTGFELTPLLEPLAAMREELVVVSGITGVGGPDSHAAGTCAFSTGLLCSTLGAAGPSIEQVAAEASGSDAPFRSLAVTANSQAHYDSNGYSSACFANVSWAAAEQPVPAESDPALLFQRLFGDGTPQAAIEAEKRAARRHSVIDHVKGEIDRLRPRLGTQDRQRLDAHLDAVREVEQRIDVVVACEVPPPPSGYPMDTWESGYDERARVLLDLLALSLSCGMTHHASFMYHDGGADDPGDAALGLPGRQHSAAHEGNRETMRQYSLAHVQALAYFLERLRQAPGATGTLLDDSLVFFGTELGNGTDHTQFDLPFVLAGRAQGGLVTGRHVRFDGESLAALHLTVLERCGVTIDSFAGTSQTLPEL